MALGLAALWFGMRAARADAPPGASDARPAIAVLPFQNQNDDAQREYLADGLTQDLINSLGRFSALTVMSWNAVARYKGAPAQPGDIARALGVRYQVEGSVRYTADRVRVSAQLVDARGRVLWSARFDEAPTDVFQLQDRITREIAGALAIRVTQFEQQRVAAKPTASFDAYDCVLRARPALQRPTRAGTGRGAGAAAAGHRARSGLRRGAFGAGRHLSRRRVHGLGRVSRRVLEPRRRAGQ